ncbi:hypothetical protein, partial [Acetatifactor aquisgranensis]|uniref:hypothetical protein n=1 Tax=Acetatifactor aquisgranensis TaxID=2941233 RepID=UPI00203B18F5
LYTSSLPRRVRDFHPLERAHGAQTKKAAAGWLRPSMHLPVSYPSFRTFPCLYEKDFISFQLCPCRFAAILLNLS